MYYKTVIFLTFVVQLLAINTFLPITVIIVYPIRVSTMVGFSSVDLYWEHLLTFSHCV